MITVFPFTKALYEMVNGSPPWEELAPDVQNIWRDRARGLIERYTELALNPRRPLRMANGWLGAERESLQHEVELAKKELDRVREQLRELTEKYEDQSKFFQTTRNDLQGERARLNEALSTGEDLARLGQEWRSKADEWREKYENLKALVDSAAECTDFFRDVKLEAAHQVERWGVEHDAGKRPEDWFTLMQYLLGKAARAHFDGNREKLLHHIVTGAAVFFNWWRRMMGVEITMRPGVAEVSWICAHEMCGKEFTGPKPDVCPQCSRTEFRKVVNGFVEGGSFEVKPTTVDVSTLRRGETVRVVTPSEAAARDESWAPWICASCGERFDGIFCPCTLNCPICGAVDVMNPPGMTPRLKKEHRGKCGRACASTEGWLGQTCSGASCKHCASGDTMLWTSYAGLEMEVRHDNALKVGDVRLADRDWEVFRRGSGEMYVMGKPDRGLCEMPGVELMHEVLAEFARLCTLPTEPITILALDMAAPPVECPEHLQLCPGKKGGNVETCCCRDRHGESCVSRFRNEGTEWAVWLRRDGSYRIRPAGARGSVLGAVEHERLLRLWEGATKVRAG